MSASASLPSTLVGESAGAVETLHACLEGSMRLLHPITPFITEELWQHLSTVHAERGGSTDDDQSWTTSVMERSYPGGDVVLLSGTNFGPAFDALATAAAPFAPALVVTYGPAGKAGTNSDPVSCASTARRAAAAAVAAAMNPSPLLA